MAKLYAEIDSDKGGRKASKGGDNFVRVDITRGNVKLGTFGVYEVSIGKTTKAGYRIVWHKEGAPYPQSENILEDTAIEDHKGEISVRRCPHDNRLVQMEKQPNGSWLCLHD